MRNSASTYGHGRVMGNAPSGDISPTKASDCAPSVGLKRCRGESSVQRKAVVYPCLPAPDNSWRTARSVAMSRGAKAELETGIGDARWDVGAGMTVEDAARTFYSAEQNLFNGDESPRQVLHTMLRAYAFATRRMIDCRSKTDPTWTPNQDVAAKRLVQVFRSLAGAAAARAGRRETNGTWWYLPNFGLSSGFPSASAVAENVERVSQGVDDLTVSGDGQDCPKAKKARVADDSIGIQPLSHESVDGFCHSVEDNLRFSGHVKVSDCDAHRPDFIDDNAYVMSPVSASGDPVYGGPFWVRRPSDMVGDGDYGNLPVCRVARYKVFQPIGPISAGGGHLVEEAGLPLWLSEFSFSYSVRLLWLILCFSSRSLVRRSGAICISRRHEALPRHEDQVRYRYPQTGGSDDRARKEA